MNSGFYILGIRILHNLSSCNNLAGAKTKMRLRFITALCTFITLSILAAAAAPMPSPALLVLNKSGAELEIIDPATNNIVGRVPTGEGPHEVATDGKIAIVCNYGAQTPGSTLSIIDLASQKELNRLQLPLQRPHGIQVLDGKAYFTAELNKVVARYDIATGALDWFMGTGQEITHMLVLNKDASAIYTANIMSDSVTALQKGDGPRPWRATHIAVGKGPEGVDMSPDGKEVWAAHSRDGGVSIIDTTTNKVKETIPQLTKRSNRLKFTPDGKRVLISDPRGPAGVGAGRRHTQTHPAPRYSWLPARNPHSPGRPARLYRRERRRQTRGPRPHHLQDHWRGKSRRRARRYGVGKIDAALSD
jgi:YVTN family beta-propeller protein